MCVCVCAAFEGAPEDVDITMFETQGAEADAIGRAAAELVAKVRSNGCLPDQCESLCSKKTMPSMCMMRPPMITGSHSVKKGAGECTE